MLRLSLVGYRCFKRFLAGLIPVVICCIPVHELYAQVITSDIYTDTSACSVHSRMNLTSFDHFLNRVWSEVYTWKYEATDPAGQVIGGWNPLIWDNLIFEHYTEYGAYWEGFCPSSMDFVYDASDPSNQFAAVTCGGFDGEGTPYMVGYYGYNTGHANSCKISLEDGIAAEVQGMYVTNLYYSYLSMLTGDGFSRPFGQGDYLQLTIHGYDENCEHTGSVDCYLADFRDGKSLLVDDWMWVDLRSLGNVMYLEFEMMSSDYSEYGINTPTYFCLDKLTFSLLSIKQQPQDTAICQGEEARFAVQIAGQDYFNEQINDFFPRLQWRKNGVDIAGENDTVLLLKEVTAADAGEYTCYVVSDYYTDYYATALNGGKIELLSNPAVLTVDEKLVSVSQSGSQELNSEESTEIHFSVKGTSPAFQWYKDGQKLAGETSEILSLPDLAHLDSGEYFCLATNQCNTLSSEKINLQVNDLSIEIIRSPEDREICRNDALQLEVEAEGTGLHYQWYRNNVPIFGATHSVYAANEMTRQQEGEYYCRISNSTGTEDSEKAAVRMLELPAIKQQPTVLHVYEKETIRLGIRAAGSNLEYQWYKDNAPLPGETADSLIIEAADEEHAGTYTCVVTNPCTTIRSKEIPVSVHFHKMIYPNPCTKGENLYFYGYNGYLILLYTEDGKILEQFRIDSKTAQMPFLYPKGVYIINGEKEEKSSFDPVKEGVKIIVK